MSVSDRSKTMSELQSVEQIMRAAITERRRCDMESLTPFLAPASNTERQLVNIWKEVLNLDEVGINDTFFELGGDSLGVVDMVSRVRRVFGVELSLDEFFESPTVEHIAQLVITTAPSEDISVVVNDSKK